MTHKAQRHAAKADARPLYSRILRLRHVQPSGLLRFVFLEGMIFAAVMLSLAELVSWWSVLVLPVAVALMIKINDVIAGAIARAVSHQPSRAKPVVGRVAAHATIRVRAGDELPVAGGAPSRSARRRAAEHAERQGAPLSGAEPWPGERPGAQAPGWTAVTGRDPRTAQGGASVPSPDATRSPALATPAEIAEHEAATRGFASAGTIYGGTQRDGAPQPDYDPADSWREAWGSSGDDAKRRNSDRFR